MGNAADSGEPILLPLWRLVVQYTSPGLSHCIVEEHNYAENCRTLSEEDEQPIQRLLIEKSPDQVKLPFALWIRVAVQRLIHQELGIQMPVRTIGDYLKRWGFTP